MSRANGRSNLSAVHAIRAASEPIIKPQVADPTVTLATTIVNGVVQGVVNGLAQVLQQVPVHQARMCARCFIGLREWENAHKPQIMAAGQAMADAVEANPETASRDIATYLSEQLRAQLPAVQYAATSVAGTEVCEMHVLDGQGPQGQKPSLLLATPHLDVSQLRRRA